MTAAPPQQNAAAPKAETTAAKGSPAETVAPERAGAVSRAAATRLGWLDALRGIAALAVVYTHYAFDAVPEVYSATNAWVSAGGLGVLTFFLISGYIVPASLERKGSVRAFWISRLFRLYPLWILALGAVFLLPALGLKDPVAFAGNWKALVASHLTMLQELIRVPNAVNVMWTLSYEMVFYFLVVALFVLRVHRRSPEISSGFALTAVIGGGGLLPSALLLQRFGWRTMTVAVVAVFVVGLALSVSGRRPLVIAGSVLLGSSGLILLAVNQDVALWWGFLLPATMFLGTAIYRAEQGQVPWWKTGAAAVLLLSSGIGAAMLHNAPDDATATEAFTRNRGVIITMVLVGVVFTIGMLLRHRRIPRFLTWLGVVSYSTYLLHPLVFQATSKWFDRELPIGPRFAWMVLWFALLLAAAWVTYRVIEAPFQKLGRRVTKAVEARFGSDRDASLRPAERAPQA